MQSTAASPQCWKSGRGGGNASEEAVSLPPRKNTVQRIRKKNCRAQAQKLPRREQHKKQAARAGAELPCRELQRKISPCAKHRGKPAVLEEREGRGRERNNASEEAVSLPPRKNTVQRIRKKNCRAHTQNYPAETRKETSRARTRRTAPQGTAHIKPPVRLCGSGRLCAVITRIFLCRRGARG